MGSVVLRPSSSWESRLWLLTWFLAPIVIVFLVTLRLPVFRDRYLTIIAPAYYLVIAVGLASIRPRWVAPVLGLALAVTAATAIAAGPLQRTDFRSAAAHYAANRQPGDVVGFEATYAARPFTWYAPSDTPVVEFPYTNDDLAPAEAQAVMARATAGSPRVWFIEHEEWLWDSRGLVRGWLESHGRLVQRVEFSGVRVSLYRLNRLSPLSPLGEG